MKVASEVHRGWTVREQGELMKIYMLMALIGAIAAMSHLDFERKRSAGWLERLRNPPWRPVPEKKRPVSP
jgi:hypothetical protein